MSRIVAHVLDRTKIAKSRLGILLGLFSIEEQELQIAVLALNDHPNALA
jgi:hypothetical protein